MNTIDPSIIHSRKIVAFFSLTLFLMLLFIFGTYAVLADKAVYNVVSRENEETQASSLEASVGDLEAKQMSLQDALTLPMAESLGFSEVSNITFITRAPQTSNLSINTR